MDTNDDDDDDDDEGNNKQRNRRDGRGQQGRGRRDNHPPQAKPAGGAAGAAVAAARTALFSSRRGAGLLASKIGASEFGNRAADIIPEPVVAALGRVPGGEFVGYVAPIVAAFAPGLSEQAREAVTDAATDAAKRLRERVSGTPVTEEGRKTESSSRKAKQTELDNLESVEVAVLPAEDIFHHPQCLQVLAIEDANKRAGGQRPRGNVVTVLRVTLRAALAQGLEPPPVATCCHRLVAEHREKIDKRREEIKKLEQEANMATERKPKSSSQLLAENPIIMQYVEDLYDADERAKVRKRLIKHLDEAEIGLFGPGMTREQFEGALAVIKNQRKAHSIGTAVKDGKKALKKLRKGLGMGKPLDEAADAIDKLTDWVDDL